MPPLVLIAFPIPEHTTSPLNGVLAVCKCITALPTSLACGMNSGLSAGCCLLGLMLSSRASPLTPLPVLPCPTIPLHSFLFALILRLPFPLLSPVPVPMPFPSPCSFHFPLSVPAPASSNLQPIIVWIWVGTPACITTAIMPHGLQYYVSDMAFHLSAHSHCCQLAFPLHPISLLTLALLHFSILSSHCVAADASLHLSTSPLLHAVVPHTFPSSIHRAVLTLHATPPPQHASLPPCLVTSIHPALSNSINPCFHIQTRYVCLCASHVMSPDKVISNNLGVFA